MRQSWCMGNPGEKEPETNSLAGWGFPLMPAPPPADWMKLYGSWEGFVREVHKSIGKELGRGVIRFGNAQPGKTIEP